MSERTTNAVRLTLPFVVMVIYTNGIHSDELPEITIMISEGSDRKAESSVVSSFENFFLRLRSELLVSICIPT
jgi:hypothetical protein